MRGAREKAAHRVEMRVGFVAGQRSGRETSSGFEYPIASVGNR
jgi:hypothetical protein